MCSCCGASAENLASGVAIGQKTTYVVGALEKGLCNAQIPADLLGTEEPMEALLAEYLPILMFLGLAAGMAVAMVIVSMAVARQNPDSEKLSPYECGFAPFEDARTQFDVRYYLVAILFIIFDLEVAFLFPWAVSLGAIGQFGFWSMMIFLALLTIGFIYEWKKGALEWE